MIFEMLLLLNTLFLRFTCSVVPVACVFLIIIIGEYYSSVWVYHIFFFQSVYQLIDIQIAHNLGLL